MLLPEDKLAGQLCTDDKTLSFFKLGSAKGCHHLG